MAFQLLTAQTSLENRLRDISDVPEDTFIEWCNFIGKELYEYVLGCDPDQFLTTTAYSAITGTQALPADFGSLKYDGCGFWIKKDDGTQTEIPLIQTNFGSQNRGYYIAGSNVIFTGIDDTLPVTLRYAPEFELFDSLTDYFTVGAGTSDPEIIAQDHMEVLVNGLCMFYARWDEDTQMEPIYTQQYQASLMDMLTNVRKTPNAYWTNDFSALY